MMLCTTLFLNGCSFSKKPVLNKYSQVLFDYFDTVATIVGYEETEEEFHQICSFIESELARYDGLYDNYNTLSSVNNLYVVNRDAGKAPVSVDEDMIKLFTLGKEIYASTNGLTDFAMGSVFSICTTTGRRQALIQPMLLYRTLLSLRRLHFIAISMTSSLMNPPPPSLMQIPC